MITTKAQLEIEGAILPESLGTSVCAQHGQHALPLNGFLPARCIGGQETTLYRGHGPLLPILVSGVGAGHARDENVG